MITIDLKSVDFKSEPYIFETSMEDLLIIKRPIYFDERGSFQEQFRLSAIENIIGRNVIIKQEQISTSKPGVIRGIHLEPQDKIVTPLTGRSYCVYLDLRPNSKTFREVLELEIDNTKPGGQLTTVFIPQGIGNSLCAFSRSGDPMPGTVIYQYSVTKEYDSKTAGMGVNLKDTNLNIKWPVSSPIVSERDLELPTLNEFINKYI